MGTNECSQPASKSSWDSQDFVHNQYEQNIARGNSTQSQLISP